MTLPHTDQSDIGKCGYCHGTGRHQGRFSGPGWPACGYCGGTGMEEPNSSVLQDDLRDMLQALGLPDGARPQSPHEVFRECVDAVAALKAQVEEAQRRFNTQYTRTVEERANHAHTRADRDRLQAELDGVRAALKPFAESTLDEDAFDPTEQLVSWAKTTVGDVQRARAALSPTESCEP